VRSGEVRRLLLGILGPGELTLRGLTLGRGDRDKVIAEREHRRYFVKLMSPAGAHATRAAAEIGLAPTVIGVEHLADGRAVVVQEFIRRPGGLRPGTGRPWDRAWMVEHADELAAFFVALARRADLLATLPSPLPASPFQRAKFRLRDMRLLEQDLRSSGWIDLARGERIVAGVQHLSDALPDEPHALVPIHGDPQTTNWIRDERGRLYLVDWDFARLDDPVTDPARLAWWLFSASAERRAFIRKCGVDVGDAELWQRAVWSVTAYAGHTALLVARQGRVERARHFLDLTEELLAGGL
jgi:Phosphotransferase enzyme family